MGVSKINSNSSVVYGNHSSQIYEYLVVLKQAEHNFRLPELCQALNSILAVGHLTKVLLCKQNLHTHFIYLEIPLLFLKLITQSIVID